MAFFHLREHNRRRVPPKTTTHPQTLPLHNQTQAELGAGYLGPPWYSTVQCILTRGSLLGLDVELGVINGVDVYEGGWWAGRMLFSFMFSSTICISLEIYVVNNMAGEHTSL